MPRGDQLSRQWRLLQLIERAAGVTVDDAAAELACTRRTIWRDLLVLQDAGLPIYDERAPDGRRTLWRLQEAFRRSLPLKLTLTELAALIMTRGMLAPLAASGSGAAVSGALDKISAVLSQDAVKLLERMRDAISVRALGAKLLLPAADLAPRIQRALLDSRSLHLTYHVFERDEITERRVDPYHLTLFEGGLYLVGYCHLRRDMRIFAVERIRHLREEPARFTKRADFDAEEYLRSAWGMLRGQSVRVRVIFSAAVARYVSERLWHPSQELRELGDGRLELTLHVADTLEVRRWVLGYGAEADVLEPASLRDALRREARAMLARPGVVEDVTNASPAPRRKPLAAVAARDETTRTPRRRPRH